MSTNTDTSAAIAQEVRDTIADLTDRLISTYAAGELWAAAQAHYYNIKLTDPDSLGAAKGAILHDITMTALDLATS